MSLRHQADDRIHAIHRNEQENTEQENTLLSEPPDDWCEEQALVDATPGTIYAHDETNSWRRQTKASNLNRHREEERKQCHHRYVEECERNVVGNGDKDWICDQVSQWYRGVLVADWRALGIDRGSDQRIFRTR